MGATCRSLLMPWCMTFVAIVTVTSHCPPLLFLSSLLGSYAAAAAAANALCIMTNILRCCVVAARQLLMENGVRCWHVACVVGSKCVRYGTVACRLHCPALYLQLRFDCDTTTIRLRRITRACFPSTRAKKWTSIFRRSRIAVESQLWYRLMAATLAVSVFPRSIVSSLKFASRVESSQSVSQS